MDMHNKAFGPRHLLTQVAFLSYLWVLHAKEVDILTRDPQGASSEPLVGVKEWAYEAAFYAANEHKRICYSLENKASNCNSRIMAKKARIYQQLIRRKLEVSGDEHGVKLSTIIDTSYV